MALRPGRRSGDCPEPASDPAVGPASVCCWVDGARRARVRSVGIDSWCGGLGQCRKSRFGGRCRRRSSESGLVIRLEGGHVVHRGLGPVQKVRRRRVRPEHVLSVERLCSSPLGRLVPFSPLFGFGVRPGLLPCGSCLAVLVTVSGFELGGPSDCLVALAFRFGAEALLARDFRDLVRVPNLARIVLRLRCGWGGLRRDGCRSGRGGLDGFRCVRCRGDWFLWHIALVAMWSSVGTMSP